MDDVDEGIGSNESNQSNKSSSDIKDELKCLNNSSIIGKDCNDFTQRLNGKLNTNGLLKYSDNIPESTKEQNDNVEIIPESSPEQNDNVENESDSISDLNDNVAEEQINDLGTEEKVNNNNHSGEGVIDDDIEEVNGTDIEAPVNDNGTEAPVNDNGTEIQQVNDNVMAIVDTEIEEQVKKDNLDNQNTEVLESTADSIDDNDVVKNDSETSNHVKHESSASDTDKPSFHIPLDAKLRNSLKGLVAKVKSSEVLKDSASPVADNSSENDEANSEITSKDELECDKDNENISNPDEQKFKESYDALLLDSDNDDDEDGIFMELGSDCEDYENALLDSGSENIVETPCNITSGKSESNETENKCESKVECKVEPECSKASSSEDTKNIKEIKSDGGVKVENNDQCTESGKECLVKSEKSSDIEEKPDVRIDISSDNNTTCEEINDSSESQSNNKKEETNEPSALKNSESKVSIDVEEPMIEESDHSEETQSEAVEPSKLNSITDNKVDSDKMLDTSKSVVIEDSPMETLGECNGIEVKEDSPMETLGDDKVVEVEEESAMEEDNDDVIFQKITKIDNKNVSQTNEPNHKPDEELAEVKVVNGNTSSLEDNDVIFEKVTNADGVSLEKPCDKVESDKVCSDKNVNHKLVNGSKHDTNVIEAGDDLVSSSSDRKRAADDSELCENDTKRKKLSVATCNGINKQEQLEEPTSIELSDSDDEDVVVSNGEVPGTEKKVSEPTMKNLSKVITVTEEELDCLVREKVKAYLASQQNTLIAKLTLKVKELQTNNDLWKRQVKDLQVKVNEVTVLQQKLEKRKAATNALRQIRTRHVAIQVDNGKTSSSKSTKQTGTPPRAAPVSVPMVTSPAGTGTIRLPIPQSSYGTTPTQMAPGTKLIPTAYKTPSVKSLLDTTKVQKTVGSVSPTATTGANSVIGVVQYPPNFMSKSMVSQGFATLPQGMVTQVATIGSNVPKTATKAMTLTSPTAKVIDLTEDDDSKNQTRFLALQTGVNPGMRTMLPPGTQLVRSGTQQNAPTYQVVFSPQAAGIRPGTMSVASSLSQTPILTGMQPVPLPISQQQQNLTPGTTMARAAVPALPSVVVQQQQNSVLKHPAPFPISSNKQHQAPGFKAYPPKPSLSISRVSQGIVLSWNMSLNDTYAKVNNYQLFAYQETSSPPVSTLWKKVGDVKALPLPMACTLTQFQVGNKYHFAVRALDEHGREGLFSDPGSIHLTAATSQSSK